MKGATGFGLRGEDTFIRVRIQWQVKNERMRMQEGVSTCISSAASKQEIFGRLNWANQIVSIVFKNRFSR
jgi:hypothetical protein